MKGKRYPIKYWSYSSLITYLRNPLAWYKRYVEEVYDLPATPASVVGRAAHVALENFYNGESKEESMLRGLRYLRDIPDFEISFGKNISKSAKKKKRKQMEEEYHQAISFYLLKAPKHKVLGVEVKAMARIPEIPIPVKAVSDLVVESKISRGAVDIVDHKFVTSFGMLDINNPLFMVQALFNYYTVLYEFGMPVRNFIVYECKKTKNRDNKPQIRKHVIDFQKHEKEFVLFHRLLKDATLDIRSRKMFLPNPADVFDGKDSLDIYRWNLIK